MVASSVFVSHHLILEGRRRVALEAFFFLFEEFSLAHLTVYLANTSPS